MPFTLEDIKRMFPETEYLSFSYEPLNDALGERVVEIADDGYQGTTRILYKNPAGLFSLYSYNWGSCSGCDFAQACNTHERFLEYANNALDSLIWMDKPTALHKLSEMELELNKDIWCQDEQEVKFVYKCRKYLESI